MLDRLKKFMKDRFGLKLFFIILGLVLCFILYHAIRPFFPMYYSKSDAIKYVFDVFNDDYSYAGKNVLTIDDEKVYQYVFKRDDGFTFSVYSVTFHPSLGGFIGGDLPWYSSKIYDDYMYSSIKFYENDINRFIDESSFDGEIVFSNSFKSLDNKINLYLNNINDLDEAAKLMVKIEDLLSLDKDINFCNLDNIVEYDYFDFNLYIKPDILIENNWTNDNTYNFGSFEIGVNESERYSYDDIVSKLEYNFVNKVKSNNLTEYNVNDDLWLKYPAEEIEITTINGKNSEIYTYILEYDLEEKRYYLPSLYIGKNSNDGEKCGNFEEIIRLLGGSYSVDGGSSSWKINNNTWTSSYGYDSMGWISHISIVKNGSEIILDNYYLTSSYGIGSSNYYVSDLEKILDASFIIDQKTMTASIVLK